MDASTEGAKATNGDTAVDLEAGEAVVVMDEEEGDKAPSDAKLAKSDEGAAPSASPKNEHAGARGPRKSPRRSGAGPNTQVFRVLISNLPFETTWKQLKDLAREKGASACFPVCLGRFLPFYTFSMHLLFSSICFKFSLEKI